MVGARVGLLLTTAALLSGCGSTGNRQDVARLQSQIGMLDERITQLERSHDTVTTAALPSEAAAQAATATAAAAQPSTATAATKEQSVKVAVKPSARDIQQALKNAGFYQGAVDGKMGPQTREAVKEFQRVHGLKDDGVVGKQTWTKLSAYANLAAKHGELDAAEILK